jgi:predicted ferric reductase
MDDRLLWYVARGSGVVALVLLSAVVVLGVLTRLRAESRAWPRFLSLAVHRDLSLLATLFLLVHIVTAVADPFTHLGLTAALVPFGSSYRPFWLGAGVVSMELMLAVLGTSLLRRHIAHRVWRAVHWLTYASWPIAVVHSAGTGTDTQSAWMLATLLVCCAAVLAAVVARVWWSPRSPMSRSRMVLQ